MPKSCPSCQAQVKKNAKQCTVCGWDFDNKLQLQDKITLAATAPKVQVRLQSKTVLDCTASSNQYAEGIPKTIEMIFSQVEPRVREITCWLQTHGDQDEGQMPTLITDGGTVSQLIEDVKRVKYEGGGDPPEHHLDAIEHALDTTPWSLDPYSDRGVIIAFLTADSKPATSGHSAKQIGEKIKEAGILLYLVCEPTPTLNELAEAAEGIVFKITNNPDLQELEKIAAQLSASIVASVGSGATTPVTQSAQ